jgi:hypothetical protein
MPVQKKDVPEKGPAAMCDNHPEVKAAHTTSTEMHRAISLCEACLRRIPYMAER